MRKLHHVLSGFMPRLTSTHFTWAVLLSEFSHVFCCVLPTIFTVISLAVNMGLISVAAPWLPLLNRLHDTMHHYEIAIIGFSGVMVGLGWLSYKASRKTDCHDTGCCHPPCDPVKERNRKILIFATALFLCNVVIYGVVHHNVFSLEMFNIAKTEHAH